MNCTNFLLKLTIMSTAFILFASFTKKHYLWSTWKTITLHKYESCVVLNQKLTESRRRLLFVDQSMLEQARMGITSDTSVHLVIVSVADLGCKDDGAYLKDIFVKAQNCGLGLCPALTGPELAIQYWSQPLGEELHIAMNPVSASSDHSPNIFSVVHGKKGLWLHSTLGKPYAYYNRSEYFVFTVLK